jgi:ribosomal protein S18 acetylase RimI-like enzyme
MPTAQRASRGRGIGTALLSLAMDRHPEGLQLWVFRQNTGARRLYEGHGFALAELTDGERNEEHEPDARYVWKPRPT